MVLEMDQAQRRDIDEVQNDRLTLAIDERNTASSPYIVSLSNFVGNNWFKQVDNFVKLNVAEQDSIIFSYDAIDVLSYKNITKILVEFDYEITNVSSNYPILSNLSLTCMEMTNYVLVETILTTQGHIGIDCSLFNFSNNVVNTAIVEQGFKVGINFNGNKSNTTVKLSNVKVKFEFEDKLESEVLAVSNRVSASFDAYVENEDLIIDFLGEGQSEHSSSSSIDIEVVEEIVDTAIQRLGVDMSIDLLNNGYIRVNSTINRGDT